MTQKNGYLSFKDNLNIIFLINQKLLFLKVYLNKNADPIFIFIIPVFSLIGFILNMLCFIVFLNKEFKELFYKYLRHELIFIMLDQLIQIFRPIDSYRHNWLSFSFGVQIFHIYFINYFAGLLEMTALIHHLLASINYYLLITSSQRSKLEFIKKISYLKMSAGVVLFSMVAFVFVILERQINSYEIIEVDSDEQNINSRVIYLVYGTYYSKTKLNQILVCFWFLFRDGFLLIMLLLLNILIYLNVSKSLKKKIIFSKKQNNVSNENKNKNDRAQTKLTIMVICTSINFIIGRLPILFGIIMMTLVDKDWSKRVDILMKIGCTTVFLSYAFLFFFNYQFNKKFRKIFFMTVRKILNDASNILN